MRNAHGSNRLHDNDHQKTVVMSPKRGIISTDAGSAGSPGGKSELMTEATRTAARLMDSTLACTAPDGDGRESLAAFAESWKETLRSSDYAAGCPIVAAALGRTESPSAADAAGEAFAAWQTMIAERLKSDGAGIDEAESLATTVVAAVEGAVILCLAAQSTDPLDRTLQMLDQLIAHHTRR
jgi:TetR/AcrR family transcriptional regulator, lmrAB and yxaGH operons repressor